MTNEEVKQLRQQLGWTQQELADALDTTVTTVSRWETGENEPNAHFEKLIEKLVQAQEKERTT